MALGIILAASCAKVTSSAGPPASGGAPAGSGSGGGGGGGGPTASGGFTGRDAGPIGPIGVDSSAPTEDANCGLQDYVLDRRPAIAVLLQDRSTSMRNTIKSVTRWAITVDAVKPVLQQTQTGISWGFKFFPDKAACGVPAGVNIEPVLNNANAIAAQLDQIKVVQNSADNLGLWDGTPVAPALRQTAKYLGALPSDKQKYIVLATDGQPTCAGGNPLTGGGNPDSDDHPSGPAAVAEVVQQGIKVAVIGIAFSDVWDPTDLDDNQVTLNDMAKAGGMPRPTDPAYYAANSAAELSAAFAQITGIVISCTFDLKGRKPPSPEDVAVKIDGTKVPRDKAHAEGWDYDADMANVVLHGQVCEQLKGTGSTNKVQIIFGCPGIIIP
ncbi:MAG: vWA domain-containing protein [Bacteroidota bacterium]